MGCTGENVIRPYFIVLVAGLASGCEFGLSLAGKNACESSADCRGDRVCALGVCSDPHEGERDAEAASEAEPQEPNADMDAGSPPPPRRDASAPATHDATPSSKPCEVPGECQLGESCSIQSDCDVGLCISAMCVTVA